VTANEPLAGEIRAPGPLCRIAEIDALRGFALFGMLVANVLMMSGALGPGAPAGGSVGGGAADAGAAAPGAVDSVVAWLVAFLAQGKFYLLFSFLFGCSFTLQRAAAERAGAGFGPRACRRLLGLFVLGVLHAVFLFVGDILMSYAVLGLILLAARNASPRGARLAAGWVWGAYSVLLLLFAALTVLIEPDPDAAAELRADAAALAVAYRGSAADVVGANLDQLPLMLFASAFMAGMVVPAFLTGLAAGRSGWFGRTDPARLRRTAWAGLAIGLPPAALAACAETGMLPERWTFLGSTAGLVSAPVLTAAYVAGLLLFFRTRPGRRAVALLAPAGRLSLTHYLTQSLVMALVFTGYGFGLYAELGVAVPVLLALLLYAVQLVVGGRLVRRFRYGPAEWLLRAFTLGRRPGGGADAVRAGHPDSGRVNER
jgi:uncharacterized protein